MKNNNFAYADMNSNLKLRLHNSIGNKYVYQLKSKEELELHEYE